MFNASCSTNQVIVIDEARYGRQRLGRCVTHDYGHLGCSADVADLLDQACSGLRWCQFSVSSIRDIVHPCPKDLTAYLEATYRCITCKIANTFVITAIVSVGTDNDDMCVFSPFVAGSYFSLLCRLPMLCGK